MYRALRLWKPFDPSDTNTVDVGGMPPGEHKVTIEFGGRHPSDLPGQSKTVEVHRAQARVTVALRPRAHG